MCAVNWAPGTLAKVTFEGKEYVAFWDYNAQWVTTTRGRLYAKDRRPVTDVRPLVVLDPEDRDQMIALHETFSRAVGVTWHGWPQVPVLRDVLTRYAEAQTKPTKPPEPTGLGAVVEDADGEVWVRFKTAEIRPWRRNYPAAPGTFFRDIDAVKVLSDGVAT